MLRREGLGDSRNAAGKLRVRFHSRFPAIALRQRVRVSTSLPHPLRFAPETRLHTVLFP